CADDPRLDHAPRRPLVRGSGMDLRRIAPGSRLHPRDRERREPARSGVRAGRVCSDDHVADFHDPHPARDLMTPGARLSPAIEVIADIEAKRRPAADALKDWGLVHRFAGSADRAAIAGLVYDALRRRASAAFPMGRQTPRAILLGMLAHERGLDLAAIGKLCDGSRHAPPALEEAERAR